MRDYGKFFLTHIEGKGYDVLPTKFIPLIKRMGSKGEVQIFTKKGIPALIIHTNGDTFTVFNPSRSSKIEQPTYA